MIVNGARLTLDPAGAVFWPRHRALVVADLHLEKGTAFAARGTLLPPYDTRTTLARLEALVERHAPELVICLGDSFHDPGAETRLGPDEIGRLVRLCRGRDWVWIVGNHDPEPPSTLDGRASRELILGPLRFRHEPRSGPAAGEVAGHLHPKAAVALHGRRLVRRCFVSDGQRLILPAFGAYAGGLDVLDVAFRTAFANGFHAHLLGQRGVYPFAAERLQPAN